MVPINLIEWRSSGHRLAYVRAIANTADYAGSQLVLWTSQECRESSAWEAHLADLEHSGVIEPQIIDVRRPWLAVFRTLSQIKRLDLGVVVPEADRLLIVLISAFLLRRLPKPTSIILMRPPNWRNLKKVVISPLKFLLIVLCICARRSFDVHLLEDPLAEGKDRIWRGTLSGESHRLDDPDVLGVEPGYLSDDMETALRDKPTLAVLGSINERKEIPLILSAWKRVKCQQTARLLIAGPQTDAVRDWLMQYSAFELSTFKSSIVIDDRYLTSEEMSAIIRRVRGLLILYDAGIASAILTASGGHGRRVITIEGTRTARIAAANGFGIVCGRDERHIAKAMETALSSQEDPIPVELDSPITFGNHILRRLFLTDGPPTRGRGTKQDGSVTE